MTVDIIIPCYYSSNIIRFCLTSITQQTVKKDITVILINDCSPYTNCNYEDLLKEFKDKLNLQYYEMPQNSGPAAVRQFGLNIATSDWVMFIDDDDELYDNTSLERLLAQADIDLVVSVTGQSAHVDYNNNIIQVYDPWIHHHGSIYNRRVLQQNNIHYDNRLTFDEDGAFSRMILYQTPGYEKLKLYEKVYRRKFNNNSLTSSNRIIDQIIGSIGLNTLDLQYYYDSIKNSNNSIMAVFANDSAVIKNLLYLLATSNNINLNHKQYYTLISFIVQFNTLKNTIDYSTLKSEDYATTLNFLNEHQKYDNYIYSLLPIKTYDQLYLEWLMAIFIKLKPE